MTPTEDSRWIADMPLGGEFSARRVLLVAEPAQRREAVAAIADIGASVMGPAAFAQASELISLRNHDAMLVELSDDCGPDLEGLLDALEQAAQRGARGVVVMPVTMIDIVTARLSAPSLTLLCQPQATDRQVELALSLVSPARLLHDVSSDGAVRLRELSEEVGRIARTLASLSVLDPGLAPVSDADALPFRGSGEAPVDAATIRTMIRGRRLRAQYFDSDLFADPAWDMLLDLTAARLERTPVAVSSLCIAAAVPPTTALRWIKTLTDNGLLVRAADPADKRRVFIKLADDTADRMLAYLSAAARMMAPLV